MIDRDDFNAKNLTSNAGLLLVFDHAQRAGVFDWLEEDFTFTDKSTGKIKMNHIKTLLCGNFIGIDKLERIKLLQCDPLVKEMGVEIKEPEAVSRFLGKFKFGTTQRLQNVNFKLFKKLLEKSRLKSILIDIDSTVINVEGHKESAAKGYIKESKYDMTVGSLLLKSSWANEAVFQLMMLKTFRLKTLFVAGRIIRKARSTMLKLAFDYPYKEVFRRYAQ